MQLLIDTFSQFDKRWALLTAGTEDRFNSMTISWGETGTLWNRPVVTVYVRTSRFTHEFMEDNDHFTVSFYPEDMRKVLGTFGSKSGRDIDKMNYEGLTAKAVGESVTFAEAELTLICKKLFRSRLDIDSIPEDISDAFYLDDDPHDMYIGEVVDILG